MVSVQRQLSTSSSSGSEGGGRKVMTEEERRLRRKISNRESAQRSRQRKQKQMEDVLSRRKQLEEQNNEILQTISSVAGEYNGIESKNEVLRAQRTELTNRLRALNNVLYIAEQVTGSSLDIPEIPSALLKPWQLPCPSQAIMASAEFTSSGFGLGRR